MELPVSLSSKSFVRGKKFYYRIGGLDFSLDEIKHGILRGNRKPPSAYMRTLNANDPKALLVRNVRIYATYF